MDEAFRWMRILGGLAVIAPFLLGRIPMARPFARRIALALAALYLLFGVSFVLWWLLIRPPVAG
jgi:hypothetical protein